MENEGTQAGAYVYVQLHTITSAHRVEYVNVCVVCPIKYHQTYTNVGEEENKRYCCCVRAKRARLPINLSMAMKAAVTDIIVLYNSIYSQSKKYSITSDINVCQYF